MQYYSQVLAILHLHACLEAICLYIPPSIKEPSHMILQGIATSRTWSVYVRFLLDSMLWIGAYDCCLPVRTELRVDKLLAKLYIMVYSNLSMEFFWPCTMEGCDYCLMLVCVRQEDIITRSFSVHARWGQKLHLFLWPQWGLSSSPKMATTSALPTPWEAILTAELCSTIVQVSDLQLVGQIWCPLIPSARWPALTILLGSVFTAVTGCHPGGLRAQSSGEAWLATVTLGVIVVAVNMLPVRMVRRLRTGDYWFK